MIASSFLYGTWSRCRASSAETKQLVSAPCCACGCRFHHPPPLSAVVCVYVHTCVCMYVLYLCTVSMYICMYVSVACVPHSESFEAPKGLDSPGNCCRIPVRGGWSHKIPVTEMKSLVGPARHLLNVQSEKQLQGIVDCQRADC